VGFVSSPWFAAKIAPILNQLGVGVDWDQFTVGLGAILTGLVGAAWNWAQHRFFKKK
jgi:hypothetical protein